ncbi:MAG: Fe(3+) ABC transporter substrate-binding protein [Hyphomicrobiales bacterium]|nr:Fe(3+) ABC transporter substrate-binding protein [Hyphomicrobiales bacterium]
MPNVPFGRVILIACTFLIPASASANGEVNLYTTREPGLIKPLLESFTDRTGVTVNTVFVDKGLAERVAAEGANSPADVLMTVDFGNLVDLKDAGVTQPVNSPVLDAAVPKNLRDPEGHWHGLSQRARVLYASKDRAGLATFRYEDLADPQWQGKVCIRSGQHPYNNALIAALIAHHGESDTKAWLDGVKANLARTASGGDRDVARDILGGICDIGIGNSYYIGLMRSGAGGPDQEEWAAAIDVILPEFEDGGTHVNISGAAIAKNAPNRDNAIALLEYLVSEDAQAIYAEGNFEYPVVAGATIDPIIAALGALSADPTPVTDIAVHRKRASELVDETGFND